ncbi:1855_t:CDS:2 [Paraglomus brasilianum]|uniref:1855_t:CDS:1 n=1 Tax=Paraglomus brasilianum TaxID=144538 RepID=A0A9N9GTX9_9GLOM|nr:1855_t:CDS:2 [Paraglomus brasilianum]
MHSSFHLTLFTFFALFLSLTPLAYSDKYVITSPTTTTDWVVGTTVQIQWNFNSTDPNDNNRTLKLELHQKTGALTDKLMATISTSVKTVDKNVSWIVTSGLTTANNYYVHLEKNPENIADLFPDKSDSPVFRVLEQNATTTAATPTSTPSSTGPSSTTTLLVVATGTPSCDHVAQVCNDSGRAFINTTERCVCGVLLRGAGSSLTAGVTAIMIITTITSAITASIFT